MNKISNRKIVITGATSMLGVALTDAALASDLEVYAIIRPDTGRRSRIKDDPRIHIIYAELGELDRLSLEDVPGNCDVFYHFAWTGTGKADRDDPLIQELNIGYTLKAVGLAEKMGCKRFVFAGSQAEYGAVKEVIDEHTPFHPTIAYGMAKFSAGMMSRKLCEQKEMEHVWARVFSVYGPHDNKGTMLEQAIQNWKRGETVHFSSGRQYWNYLYETDAGEMFLKLGSPDVESGTYFVAGKESIPLREYIEILRGVFGTDAKAEFADADSDRLPGLNVDMQNTLGKLKYEPRVAFSDGIRKMIEELK